MEQITAFEFVRSGLAEKLENGEVTVWIAGFPERGEVKAVDAETIELRTSTGYEIKSMRTDLMLSVQHNAKQATPAASEGEGMSWGELRDSYLSAGGMLAIVASWLRGSKGNMDDLTAQNVYDMIAKEQGMSEETITTALVEQAELTALRDQLAAVTRERDAAREALKTANEAKNVVMEQYNQLARLFGSRI